MLPTPRGGKRLLLVEDDLLTREAVTLLLCAEGYRVTTTANGRDALERLKHSERPDLILVDLAMPLLDGPGFCQHLRSDATLSSIPILVFSGAADGHEKARALGAAGYLRKPVEVDELLSARPPLLSAARGGPPRLKEPTDLADPVLWEAFRLACAILAPPLGVFLTVGLGMQFGLSVLLTVLGYVPGILHAIWIVVTHTAGDRVP